MKYFKFCIYIVLLTALPPMLKAEEELNRPVTAHDYLEGEKKTNLIEEHASLLHRLKFWNKNAKQEYDAANTAKMLSNETERSHYFNKFKLRREGKLNSIDEWWNESKIKLALEAQQFHNFKIIMKQENITAEDKKTVIRYLPVSMIKFITPDEIREIPDNFIRSFQPEQIKFFTREQIQALKTTQIEQLTEIQIKAFTEEQIKAFTDEQIKAFTDEQIIAFKDRTQKLADKDKDVKKKILTDLISKIDTIRSAITNNDKEPINKSTQKLTTKEIQNLTPQEIQDLTTGTNSSLTIQEINLLTKKQLDAFTEKQIQDLITAQEKFKPNNISTKRTRLIALIERINQNKSQQSTAS